MDQRLPCRCLTGAPLHHLPHDDLLHQARIYPGAGDRVPDDHGAELGGRKGGQAAEIAADRSADGRDDDWGGAIAHGVLVRFGFRCGEITRKSPFVT